MKKTVGILVLTAFAALIGRQLYVKLSAESKSDGRGGPVVTVELAPVAKRPIRRVEVFAGNLVPNSYFVIAPKVAGRLEKLHVNIGDRVQNGQLIAELDDDEYAQQVEQARAELEVAKANADDAASGLEDARRDLDRVNILYAKDIASEVDLENAKSRYNAQNAKVKVAAAVKESREAALRSADVRLGYTRIHVAWQEGDAARTIGERFVDEGAMLSANAPIVSVVEDDTLTAVVNVIEKDYPLIHLGQTAMVSTDAYPSKAYEGKVVRIAPLLKESSRQARVELEIPNGQRELRAGMFVRVEVELEKRDEATVVPITALVRRNNTQGVFIADTQEMKAQFVPVRAGIMEGDWVEIVEPNITGMVVTLGQQLLEDKAAINVPDAEGKVPKANGTPGGRN